MVKHKILNLLDGRKVVLYKEDARSLLVSPQTENILLDEDKNIISIKYSDDIEYKIGDCVEFDKGDKFKIQSITLNVRNGTPGYNLNMYSLTKSSQFIMPFLGGNRQIFRWNKNFCTCFIGTEFSGDYGSSIYLLYRWDSDKDFSEFESKLADHTWYTGTHEPDKYHTLYEFCIPNGHSDILNIIKGKYSFVSPSGKEQILNFHGAGDNSKLAKIFRKDISLRQELEAEFSIQLNKDSELLSIFNIQEEMYLNKYRIIDGQHKENDISKEIW